MNTNKFIIFKNYSIYYTMFPKINRQIQVKDPANRKEKTEKEGKEGKEGKKDLSASKIFCSICFQELQYATMDRTVTRCNHYFCTSCLLKNMKYNNKCPLCRVVLLSPNKKFSIGLPLSEKIVEEELQYYDDYIKQSLHYVIDNIEYHTMHNTITDKIKENVCNELLQVFENFGMGVCLNVNTRFREYDVFNTGGASSPPSPSSPSPAVSVSVPSPGFIMEQTENLIVDSQSAPVILAPITEFTQNETAELVVSSRVNEEETNVSLDQIEPEGVFSADFEM